MSKPVAIVKIVDEETGEVLRDSKVVPLYLTNPYDNWSRKYLAKVHYMELKTGDGFSKTKQLQDHCETCVHKTEKCSYLRPSYVHCEKYEKARGEE